MARVTNALLVRWSGGFTEVTDAASIAAHGRLEDFLSAGDAQSVAEAQRIATAWLADHAWPIEEVAVAIDPTGVDDVPYDDFVVGDTVVASDSTGTPVTWRVIGFTVTEDPASGEAIVVPELRPAEGP